MADTITDTETADTPHPDDAWVESVAAKYTKQDEDAAAAAAKAENEKNDEDDVEDDEGDSNAESDDSTEEHTDEGTSTDDPDGDAAESGEDSAESDEADHTEGDEPEESTENADADDEEGDANAESADDDEANEDDEDEDPVSEEFTDAAARLGIPLTLEDIPEGPARQLAKQKLKAMDSGYTRAMAEARSYRAEQLRFHAEELFRKENPDIVIAEMLQADPTLIERVNERTDKLADPDHATAFEIVVKKKRDDATVAVKTAIDANEQRNTRALQVETLAKRLAAKQNLPWEFAESAVERALLRLPDDKRDLTDEQVGQIVKAEADNYSRHVRAHRREASKKTVQQRTANRRVSPGAKHPSSAATPRPQIKRKSAEPKNEEERHERGMQLARKLFPGAKDE